MIVRMPHAEIYAQQPAKEWQWLPYLGAQLSLPIPKVMGRGQPDNGYPFCWTILSYLKGDTIAAVGNPNDSGLAGDLGTWLATLRKVPPGDGPRPGPHNFYRGGDLRIYDQEIRHTLQQLGASVDQAAILKIWNKACQSTWAAPPVWLHGDVAVGNFLMADGKLSAAIDFGSCGIGDPACDLTIAWTFFQGNARDAFRRTVSLDDATWARARGWAAWKGCLQVAKGEDAAQTVIRDLCANI